MSVFQNAPKSDMNHYLHLDKDYCDTVLTNTRDYEVSRSRQIVYCTRIYCFLDFLHYRPLFFQIILFNIQNKVTFDSRQ